MSFEHPFVLLGIPLVAVGLVWTFSRVGRSPSAAALQRATSLWAGPSGVSERPKRVTSTGGIALVLGSALVLVSLARPQWGAEEEVIFDPSREVVIALDLSRSMSAADVTPTRLDRSKMLIDSLFDELRGERVGLVVFAGTSFLQVPLSADYEVMRDLVPELSPDYLPQGGTDFAAMLRTALRSFHDADGRGDRFLIVLSDGEAHEEDWRSLLPTLRARGIRVLGLGVATAEGAMIPDGRGGVIKDSEGAVVLSRLAPATLQELARETDGTYRDAASWVDLHQLVETTVARGLAGDYREESDRRRQDRFQWFLLPGFALLGLAFWLDLPVPVARRRIRDSRPLGAAVKLGLALCITGMFALSRDAVAVESSAPLKSALAQVVAGLVEKSDMQATDYARLAEVTVEYVETEVSLGASVRAGVIDDAEIGVDHGEALDASASDWPALRRQLASLRTPAAPPDADESPSKSDAGSAGELPDDATTPDSDEPSVPPSGNSQDSAQTGESGSSSVREGEEPGPGADSDSEPSNSESRESAPESKGESGGAEAEGAAPSKVTAHRGDPGPSDPDRVPSTSQPTEPDTDGDSLKATGAQASRDRPTDLDPEAAGIGELESGERPNEEAPKMGSGGEDDEPRDVPETGERGSRRIVGGGSGEDESVAFSSPMFGALGRMEEIRKNDSPGHLFSRMNAMEDPRQRTRGSRGKDW